MCANPVSILAASVVSAEMTEEVPVPREELNEPGTEYTCRWVMVRI